MSRKFKKLLIICICVGMAGGFTEFFGPTLTAKGGGGLNREKSATAAVSAPAISAEGAILTDAADGSIIYEKGADMKLYPASTTKIMTALVAFEIMDEIGADLDSQVVIPKEATGAEGSSIYLKAGEKITLRELMYGMLLKSGNDAAMAVAVCCGGSESAFIKRMNLKAEELGCGSTHFTNPSGLFEKEHYTTARDLARISAEAMKREAFRQIVSAASWESPDSGRNFYNKNKTVNQYPDATGIKIGYTKGSGRTLVASAKRNGKELIAVVLNDSNWFNDAYSMLDYGFAQEN